ncbi:MAG: hypothetical protein ACI8S6_000373 [Myxococcota bacterium]|jgi:hypothetical protein
MHRLLGVTLLGLLSCNLADKPATLDTGALAVRDADGDGFDVDDGDCNDSDATISPSAVELCDGIDNDCDGLVDEDVTRTAFADADEDGFGDPDTGADVCEFSDGAVANANDCDDTDDATYPGSTEVCDGRDNDCDTLVDEDVTTTFYADADADGYGDPGAWEEACAAPAGMVVDGTDCDDTTDAANPASAEICDEIDNDCDDDVDEGVTTTWYQDVDDDGYGIPGVTTEACVEPSGYAAESGDCDDNNIAYNPGAAEDDCTDPSDYNCDGSVQYADTDGDGWPACEDCDDTDAAVNPDGDEICNSIDDDCDGDIDDDDSDVDTSTGSTFYGDGDGDGYGDIDDTLESCAQPSGYVSDDTDCDDGDSAVRPSATEVCNDIDDDCDGDIDDDDGDVDTSTGSTFYGDDDADGYGDADDTLESCAQPSGYVSNDSDCDDGDSAISPIASEVCDSIDNDCDGDIDDDDVDIADQQTWYIDYDSDGYGSSAYTTDACEQPTGYVGDASDCDDGDAAVSPDGDEVCNSIDDDCDGDIDDDDGDVDTSTGSTFYSDGDGDGYGAGSGSWSCVMPSGYAASSSDCDDGDSGINPGATEVCNGDDEDCDSYDDEGLTCSYKLVQSDLASGLCVDDDVYVDVNGTRVYTDTTWGAQCGHVVTFSASPGDTISIWAVDSVGGCRNMSDVYIVNVSGSVGQYLTSGYSNTCGHSASSSAFWSQSVAVPSTF